MDPTDAPSSEQPNQMGEVVMDAETDDSSAAGAKVSATPPAGKHMKKTRKRKKQMFNQIRQQIEFYFSDANLSKDRFLKKLMEKDPEVPLDVFMTFNKIKAMASSVEEIEKAISTSEKLALTADRKRVSRIAAFTEGLEPDKSADERTIYVEALPTSASHDWVRKVFEQYGPVAYVSLPRFRTSRQIKEFAFVEFEAHGSVLKAINSFAQFGGALNMSSDPDKLGSVTAYLREKETEAGGTSSVVPATATVRAAEPVKSDETVKGELCVEPTSKRAKLSTDETVEPDTKPVDLSETEQVMESTDKEVDDEDEAAKKKVRRKKSTSKHHPKTAGEQQLDASVNTLRITTKIEWKRLRNKYLNQQREKIKLMNAANRRPRSQRSPNNDEVRGGEAKRNDKINFYGAEKEMTDCLMPVENSQRVSKPVFARKTVDAGNKTAPPVLPFEEGVIVKINFNEPCVDVKDFKSEMRQYPFVRYVDVKEGDLAAFVRVEAPGLAPELVQRSAPLVCNVLADAEEKEYWNKINQDRFMKLSKQLKVKPVRGRTKVAAAAAGVENSPNPKHVRFGEE